VQTNELAKRTAGGWPVLWLMIAAGIGLGYMCYWIIANGRIPPPSKGLEAWAIWWMVGWGLVTAGWGLCWNGFYTLQPNQAAVLVLFGRYVGTDNVSGFRWANPLFQQIKVSLRARNLNMQTIKVNDQRGNPVEIAAVVVWRVENTAQATFDVDNFEHYVSVQSEAALRHLASGYPYDTTDEHTLSLRGSMDEVSHTLTRELQDRVLRAGVRIEEARLSHLAYAPEIAGAMLQRQQAEAIVAARTRIVDGAVGIVEMALAKLQSHELVQLDEERKAAMVNNLLVVLCGDKTAHPVVHAGTLYS
jgi:regulator of protease activity HflC (stomatin/prohibitin superfamily)